jgi:excisionase family DNA binding protein
MSSNYSTVDEDISVMYNGVAMKETSFKGNQLSTVDEEELLSVADAAKRLGLHRTRINQLIDSGDLPAKRVGRGYVISEVEVDLLKERRALELLKEKKAPGRPPKSQGEEKAKSRKSRVGAKKKAK